MFFFSFGPTKHFPVTRFIQAHSFQQGLSKQFNSRPMAAELVENIDMHDTSDLNDFARETRQTEEELRMVGKYLREHYQRPGWFIQTIKALRYGVWVHPVSRLMFSTYVSKTDQKCWQSIDLPPVYFNPDSIEWTEWLLAAIAWDEEHPSPS